MSDDGQVSISQVGKARAAEIIAAFRIHGRPPDEEAQLIMATGLYLLGVLLASCATEEQLDEQREFMDARMPEVIADLKEEMRNEQEGNDAATQDE